MLDALATIAAWLIYAIGAVGVTVIVGIGLVLLYAAYLKVTKKPEEKQGSKTGRKGLRQGRAPLKAPATSPLAEGRGSRDR